MSTETVTEAVVTTTTETGQPAPVIEQALETQSEQAETTNDDESQDDTDPHKEPRKRPRWSDVNRANREALDARREADAWRQKALGEQRQEPAVQPQPASSKPTLEQFDYDQEAYQDAAIEWRLEQREVRAKQAVIRNQEEEARIKFEDAQADFAAAHDDYEDLVQNPHLRITDVMAGAIHESDVGPQIAYHLGQNPAEAARIADLSPISQARAIGRIEAALAASGQSQRLTKPIQTTRAPPPPPSITSTAPVKRQESQMSDTELVAAILASKTK